MPRKLSRDLCGDGIRFSGAITCSTLYTYLSPDDSQTAPISNGKNVKYSTNRPKLFPLQYYLHKAQKNIRHCFSQQESHKMFVFVVWCRADFASSTLLWGFFMARFFSTQVLECFNQNSVKMQSKFSRFLECS